MSKKAFFLSLSQFISLSKFSFSIPKNSLFRHFCLIEVIQKQKDNSDNNIQTYKYLQSCKYEVNQLDLANLFWRL